MTNYIVPLAAAIALLTGACHAADTPATPKPASGKPAPAATAAVAAPAGPAPAAAAPATAALPRWVQAPGSSLTFTFNQAGAASKGSFKQFATELVYDEKTPDTGSLNVKVQIGTVDTKDQERNDLIVGADLFDAKKFPTAQYTATTLAKSASGDIEAVGKLTLRGVTRDLRLPLKIVKTAAGLELSGETAIKRLDYGVGQGDWKSTGDVGDQVKIEYKVALTKAK